MNLPAQLREGVERALSSAGLGSTIERASPVGGGCINNSTHLRTDAGSEIFLKWNAHAPRGMFGAEVGGLEALGTVQGLRVPAPIAHRDPQDGGPSWLLMEFIRPGPQSARVQRALGERLSQLHSPRPKERFGWGRDNWIGSLPQANEPRNSWSAFWRDMRLSPQLTAARARGSCRDAVFDRLLDVVPLALDDVESPCLIHGDLWAGNTFASALGEPVIIDPAVYLGHGEVDLAMSELFGGFDPDFYEAYASTRPISAEYGSYRRDLYQLYYLLVHVNLFGSSYESGCHRAARSVLDKLE